MTKHWLLAAALVVVACTPRLDHKKLEEQIEKGLAAKGVEATGVTCPEGVKLTKGATFQCTGKDSNGTQATFDVAASGDATGTVSWQLHGLWENMDVVGDRLEQGLSKKSGMPVDVQCPHKNIIIQKGVTFSCNAMVQAPTGTKTLKYTFTAQSDTGDWDVKLQSS
jgi:Domain of unknown function (DUF4333)